MVSFKENDAVIDDDPILLNMARAGPSGAQHCAEREFPSTKKLGLVVFKN
jgi:hypothetical protein